MAPTAPDGAGEEAEPAVPPPTEPTATDNTPPAPDDEGMVWPEGATVPESGEPQAAAPAGEEAPLPKLDELTKRIPESVKATLDDLFRARFVAVRRAAPKALKH